MNKPFDLKKFLIPLLRRKSMYYPERNRALQLARIDRGFYRCAFCKQGFSRKQVRVDHINSVVSVKDGWVDWDHYINRLFVPAEQLQVLCIEHHEHKTQMEQALRVINKKKVKKTKK